MPAILWFMAILSQGAAESSLAKETLTMWKQTEFIISSFQALNETDLSLEYLKTYAAAGFNTLETMMPREDTPQWKSLTTENIVKVLGLCEKAGIKVLVVDHSRFTGCLKPTPEMMREAIALYSDKKSFLGYYIWDEPAFEDACLNAAREMTEFFRRQDPGHLPYSVICPACPAYPFEKTAGKPTYTEYVEKYLSTLKPSVLAYDYYPFEKKSGEDYRSEGWKRYWNNLAFISKRVREENLSFWMYIQSCGWDNGNMVSPTADQIRFQAWMAIAHGAKGLQYLLYRNNKFFTDAIADEQGKPLTKYKGVAELNREINTLGPTLVKLKHMGIYHTDADTPPYANPISELAIIRTINSPLVIGQFTDEQKNSFLVTVNKSYRKKVTATLTFNESLSVLEINKTTGKPELKGKDLKQISLDFEPGEGRLLHVGF